MKIVYRRFVKASALFLLFLLAFGLGLSYYPVYAVGSEEASSAIQKADSELRQAFVDVLEAESAGADVSGLIVKLNEAGEHLAKSRISYNAGNFSEAVTIADRCSGIAYEVADEGARLRSSALAAAQMAVWHALISSSVEVIAFLTVLFLVWRWFKRIYVKKLFKTKPEVLSDEA